MWHKSPAPAREKASLADIFSEQLREKLDREEEDAFIRDQLRLFDAEEPRSNGDRFHDIPGLQEGEGRRNGDAASSDKSDSNGIKTTPILASSEPTPDVEPGDELLPPSAFSEENSLDYALALQLQEEENETHFMHVRQHQKNGPNAHVSVVLSTATSGWVKAVVGATPSATAGAKTRGYDEEEEDTTQLHVDRREEEERKLRRKLSASGGSAERTTKHDITLNGHLNARRLERTVPNCGDLGNQLIPNKIYNSLQHRVKKQAHAEKGISSSTVERETYSTSKGLDHKSRLTIQKMLNGGLFDRVDGVVQTGKESVVFHAVGPAAPPPVKIGSPPFPARKKSGGEGRRGENENEGDDEDDDDEDEIITPDIVVAREEEAEEGEETKSTATNVKTTREYAIKVYKTTLNEFRNRAAYVEGDHRFDALGELSRLNPRKVIKIWAEKELKNLARASRAGLPVPEPVRLHNHVLVMSFLGRDGVGLPRLCEFELAALPREIVKRLFLQVLLFAEALLRRARLVHADLSEYNLLVEEPWTIRAVDFGQATDPSHPHARTFLERDLRNVFAFFLGKGAAEEAANLAKRKAVLNLMTRGTKLGVENEEDHDEEDESRGNWSREFARSSVPWGDAAFASRLDSMLFSGD